MKRLVLFIGLCFSVSSFAETIKHGKVDCLKRRHASNDRVEIQKDDQGGTFNIKVSGYGGWTKHVGKILDLPFDVKWAKFSAPKDGCRQRSGEQFPILCHAGTSTLEVGNKEQSAKIPLYYAMLRLSPASLDDLYDYEERDVVLGRFAIGTLEGQTFELSQVFKTADCRVE